MDLKSRTPRGRVWSIRQGTECDCIPPRRGDSCPCLSVGRVHRCASRKRGGRPRFITGALDPAATERPVEVYEVGEALQPRADERELRVVEAGLCREPREIVVDAVSIAEGGKVERPLLRRRVAFGRGDLVVIGAARSKAIRDFPEGRLDRLLVLRDADVLLNSSHVEAGLEGSGIEDGDRERRDQRPERAAPAEQSGERRAGGP